MSATSGGDLATACGDSVDTVLRVGITGSSGRLGSLLCQSLGTDTAPLNILAEEGGQPPGGVVVVPFTFDVADYRPWAGTAGAGDAALFAEAVDRTDEVAVAKATGRAVRKPQHLDLGDA